MAHLYVASRRVLKDRDQFLAIYHFDAKIVSRANGQSVVASAAYRASESLRDERYGLTHDYTRKQGVAHSEILLPKNAAEWMADRQTLWNRVETSEKRKDAQLARELELALPIELSHSENVALVRDYLMTHFVGRGMVADFSVHEDDANNPHAHVLLTMREVTSEGFGQKVRSWNAKAELLGWRAAWAETANQHLAQAGHAVKIDHRTLEAQDIELEPGRKIGIALERQAEQRLPRHIAERIAEANQIAHANGQRILNDPTLALRAMTHQRATFTERDIAKFLHTRTFGAEQFQAAHLKVTTCAELVALGKDDANRVRYTTREMLDAEKSLINRSNVLHDRQSHGVKPSLGASALSQASLSSEQAAAFDHVTAEGDLKALVGLAGSGKSTLLAAARHAWEAQGLTVKGAALSGIAAENLQSASGINSRTLASYEYNWKEGRETLTRNDVLVIDEAGMVGTRQLERMLAAAERAHAKVVLVGDPEQLQAIEAGAAFRAVLGQTGMATLAQVRRQEESWSREATQALATGRTVEALTAYESHGAIIAAKTREEAERQLLSAWAKDRKNLPTESRLILAYTRDDVRDLNREAREILKGEGRLAAGETIETARGNREFAAGDRIMFLRNERSLGVKNGTLGTLERISNGVLQVRVDGREETRIAFETKDYRDFDHGYASTIHKSQGATVDRSYILASQYFDRHSSYVALSRHRYSATLYYGQDDFTTARGEGASDASEARMTLASILSRARPKELAHDYLDPEPAAKQPPFLGDLDKSTESLQARGRAAWLAMRAKDLNSGASPEDIQLHAREKWKFYRQEQRFGQAQDTADQSAARSENQDQSLDDEQSL